MKSLLCSFSVVFLFFSVAANAQGWRWATGSSCPQADAEGMAIAADTNGNTFSLVWSIAGTTPPTTLRTIFGPFVVIDTGYNTNHTIIVSNDSNGNYRWAVPLQNGRVVPKSIKTDRSGDVYVLVACSITGGFRIANTTFSGNNAIIKLTGAGALVWIRPLPYVYGSLIDFDVSNEKNIYVAGYYGQRYQVFGTDTLYNHDTTTATTPTYDIVIAKYDSGLNYLWAKEIGGERDDEAIRVCASDTFVFITGHYRSSSVSIGVDTLHNSYGGRTTSVYLAKYTQSGMPVWARNAFSDSTLYVSDVVADQHGNAYLTGSYHGKVVFAADTLAFPTSLGLTYILKYDSEGNPKWARTVRITNFVDASDMAIDQCGQIWLSGRMLFGSSGDPMFLLHYDTSGNIYDTLQLTSGGDDASGVALDGKGNLYLCGDYYNSFTLGTTTLPPDSSDEAFFVGKYNYSNGCRPVFVNAIDEPTTVAGGRITLFPNPANGKCSIVSSKEFGDQTNADFYDMSGRLIATFRLLGRETTVDLGQFSPGVYLVKVVSTVGEPVVTLRLVVAE